MFTVESNETVVGIIAFSTQCVRVLRQLRLRTEEPNAYGTRVWQACPSRVAIARAYYCDCTADWLHLSYLTGFLIWPTATVPNGKNTVHRNASHSNCSHQRGENCLSFEFETIGCASVSDFAKSARVWLAREKTFVPRNARIT